jgi:hypothetical protein
MIIASRRNDRAGALRCQSNRLCACGAGCEAGHGPMRVVSSGSPSAGGIDDSLHRASRFYHTARRRGGVATRGARGRRQSYLRAKRSMIALNFGSFTFSAACEAESHFTTRSRFSGHCLFWRLTSRGKTRTLQTTAPPFLSRFSYENEPTERRATAPTTPASSKASRAAE